MPIVPSLCPHRSAMTRSSQDRFSLITMLLSAAVALRTVPNAAEVARADENRKETHSSLVQSRLFELTVLGPDGKKVLPAVQVEFRSEPAITAQQVREGKFLRSEPDAVFVESNSSGRVSIELPLEIGRLEYGVETPGFAPRWKFWNPAVTPLSRFTLQLAPAWSFGGIVVDRQGKPVEGARICPIRTDFNGLETLETRFGQHCRTDAQGKWRYDSVPASQSEFKAEIDHPQFAPERRSLSRAEFGIEGRRSPAARILLEQGITVTGKVMDERGAPIPGASIRIGLQHALREAVSGADGVYQVRGCGSGISAVVASAKGCATEVHEHWIGPAPEPVDFRLKPGGVVRIRVVDEHGKPCPGARVHLLPQRRYANFEFDNVNQIVDRDGRWEWREAPREQIPACVQFPDGARSDNQQLARDKEEYLFKETILTVTGAVVDRITRQPIKSFRVLEAIRPGGPQELYYENARYVDDGRYQVRLSDQPFPHVVRIEAEGYQPQLSRDIMVKEKAARVDFELTAGQNVEGVVLTPAGLPAAAAKMAVAVGDNSFTITNGDLLGRSPVVDVRETDASGHFRFPPQDRDYYLVIIHPSGHAWFRPIPRSNRRRITLDPWARAEGTYRVGGRPLAGAQMSLFAGELRPLGDDGPEFTIRSQTVTGADGGFVFDRVPACSGQVGRVLKWAPRIGNTELESACTVDAQFSSKRVVRIEVGQNGRAVIGKLKPARGFDKPVLWQFAWVDVVPNVENHAAENRRYQATIDRDGRFRVDDLPPGYYSISSRPADFVPGYLFAKSFVVPGEDIRPFNQPLDLGELEVQMDRPKGSKGSAKR
jgi:hypothetical protein